MNHRRFVAARSGTEPNKANAAWGWVLVQNQNLDQKRAANELENVRKELQAKIDDRDFRLSSIERHIGDKSFWDLSTLMVTPLQMKTLDRKYIHQKEINCFLSVPASASWHFIKVNGITMQMLFGNPKPSDESDPFFAGNSQSDHNTAFEKLLASIEEAMGTNIPPLTSDSSSFWASQFILQGFQLVKKIPKSTFHLLNAEKKENVFYLSFRTVFSPSEATAEIYWDQELILIGTGKTTLLVTTSAPWSADTRFVEGPWMAAWLAGLRYRGNSNDGQRSATAGSGPVRGGVRGRRRRPGKGGGRTNVFC